MEKNCALYEKGCGGCPLLKMNYADQLKAKHGDAYNTRHLDEGPERWRILIRKTEG